MTLFFGLSIAIQYLSTCAPGVACSGEIPRVTTDACSRLIFAKLTTKTDPWGLGSKTAEFNAELKSIRNSGPQSGASSPPKKIVHRYAPRLLAECEEWFSARRIILTQCADKQGPDATACVAAAVKNESRLGSNVDLVMERAVVKRSDVETSLVPDSWVQVSNELDECGLEGCPNRECREKQLEAKTYLRALIVAVESYNVENGKYLAGRCDVVNGAMHCDESMSTIGFQPHGVMNYNYEVAEVTAKGFIGRDSGVGEMSGDLWTIDEEARLVPVSNLCRAKPGVPGPARPAR